MPIPEHMTMTSSIRASEMEAMETSSVSSSHQEFCMETMQYTDTMLDLSDAEIHGDSMMSVKDKQKFFEEAQKAEVNKQYLRKDPIDIPERLGADGEEEEEEVIIEAQVPFKEDLPRIDLSRLVNRFESPQPKVYTRKDPIQIPERLGSDTEEGDAAEIERKPTPADEMPSFDMKAIKNVFELGQPSFHHVREEKRDKDGSGSFSETQSVTEHYTTMDEFGNTITVSGSSTTSHAESVQHSSGSPMPVPIPNPPSYAEVVKGGMGASPEPSAEELLKGFQQSWVESETVFRNLGFSANQQSRSSSSSSRTVTSGKKRMTKHGEH